MKIRTSALVAICLLVTLPDAAFAQGRARRFAPANAGTGPYELSSLSGITQFENGPIQTGFAAGVHATGFLHAIESNDSELATREMNLLLQQVDAPGAEFPNVLTKHAEELQHALAKLLSQRGDITQLKGEAAQLVSGFYDFIQGVIEGEEESPEHYRLQALKVGSYWRSTGSYAFESLSFSDRDRSLTARDNVRIVPYFAESALVSASGQESPATARFGTGLAFGNPDRWVGAVGLASFVSPYMLDALASLSIRFGPSEGKLGNPFTDSLPALEFDTAVREGKRNLLDHVRPGDFWLFGGYRTISEPGSGRFAGNNIEEGALTYAIRGKSLERDIHQNPILAATLTVSGTYCSNHDLNLDELGFEARAPIGVRDFEHSVFVSARYGTRGSFTLSVESRF